MYSYCQQKSLINIRKTTIKSFIILLNPPASLACLIRQAYSKNENSLNLENFDDNDSHEGRIWFETAATFGGESIPRVRTKGRSFLCADIVDEAQVAPPKREKLAIARNIAKQKNT